MTNPRLRAIALKIALAALQHSEKLDSTHSALQLAAAEPRRVIDLLKALFPVMELMQEGRPAPGAEPDPTYAVPLEALQQAADIIADSGTLLTGEIPDVIKSFRQTVSMLRRLGFAMTAPERLSPEKEHELWMAQRREKQPVEVTTVHGYCIHNRPVSACYLCAL